MAVGGHNHQHSQFVDDQDLPQRLYERARRAALDRRLRVDQSLTDTLQAHGVAGLFIDPESIVVSSSLRGTRSSAVVAGPNIGCRVIGQKRRKDEW